MRIPSLFKATALSALMLTGCSRGPLHKVETATPLTHMADSLSKATQNVLKDKTLRCFYTDTVEISKSDLKKPQKFMDRVTSKAKWNIPQEKVGERDASGVTITSTGKPGVSLGSGVAIDMDGNIGVDMSSSTEDIMKNLIDENSVKVVIGKGVFTNKSEKSLYIPVKGYGKDAP